jgi:putative transposase
VTYSHKVNAPLNFEIGDEADSLKVKQMEIFNDNLYQAKGKFFVSITYDVDLKDNYYDNDI